MTNSSNEYYLAKQIIQSISPGQIDLVKTKKDHQSYELFIFSLIARKFNHDHNIQNFRLENVVNNIFKPKLSPGNLDRIRYSYASFEYNNQSFEIHLDTYFRQKSRVKHELDIAIIPSESFPQVFICCAIECKNYIDLPFSLGREFIGTLQDFNQTHNIYADFMRLDFLVNSGPLSSNNITKFQNYFSARTKKFKNKNYNTTYIFDNTNAFMYHDFVNKIISDFKTFMH